MAELLEGTSMQAFSAPSLHSNPFATKRYFEINWPLVIQDILKENVLLLFLPKYGGPSCPLGSDGSAHILEKEEIYPDEDGSSLIFVMWLLKHQVPL